MSRSTVRTALRPRLALLAVAAVVAALLSVAVSGGASVAAGPVSSNPGGAAAALEFAGTEHSVLPMSQLLGRDSRPGGTEGFPGSIASAVPSHRFVYFGELKMEERSGTDLDLDFNVEGQPDRSLYEFCKRGSSTCHKVELRVTEQGLLYLWNPAATGFGTPHWSAAFPQQRLEVSASDAGTGLKVYRDVLVNPPPGVQDCEDYGDFTVEAYVCLFQRQRIPEGAVDSTSSASLEADLPLVQDTSNYRLVFAEEFGGTPPSADASGCSDGLSTLNSDVWNYLDPCAWKDSRNVPCSNIADGSLYIAAAYKCGANTNTFGKLYYKYGYLEFKFTVNMDAWTSVGHHNLNLVAWAPGYPEQHLWSKYGVTVNDWEDFLKYSTVELDFLEYVPNSRHSAWNHHANWGYPISGVLQGHRAEKRIDYCRKTAPLTEPYWLFLVNPNDCESTDTHTVTLGVEWTPRGYRTFVKWDGIQDAMTVWPENKIAVWERIGSGTGSLVLAQSRRDRYFEYVDPDDTDTILEQVGIAHTPNPLSIGAWGLNWTTSQNYIRTRLKYDYIRLWQPTNHYSDMEPLYQ